MEDIILAVYNTEGKEVETITLEKSVFGEKVNADAIYQAVNAYLAAQRKGLAATKTRGEVSGGGRKPWKQKGTGRARVGSTRSPLWRHGGVVFGPHPRDFSYTIPQKIKDAALKSAFLSKAQEKKIIILDNLTLEKPKTKEAVKIFSNLQINSKKKGAGRVLLLLDKPEKNLRQAMSNIEMLKINLVKDTFVYEVLNAHKLVITKDAFNSLTKRLKK